MAVSVQLPGYNHAAPAVGLAQVLGEGVNAYKNYQQGKVASDQADASARNERLQKDLQDPNSQASEDARSKLAATAQVHMSLGKKAGLNDKDLSPLGELVNYAKNGVTTEAPMPAGVEGPGLPQTRKMSGLEAIHLTDSALLKSIDGYIKGDQAAKAMSGKLSGLVDTKNNQLADQIAEHFTKNPSIQKWQKQKDQAQIDLHTLQSGAEITSTVKAEIEKGIANFLSGGGSAGLGATEKMEFNNLYTVLAKGRSFWTSTQQKADPPGYRQYLTDTLERLDKGADLNMWAAAQRISSQKQGIYKGNPQADQSLRQSLETYRPAWMGQQSAHSPPGQSPPAAETPPKFNPVDVAAELRKRGAIK